MPKQGAAASRPILWLASFSPKTDSESRLVENKDAFKKREDRLLNNRKNENFSKVNSVDNEEVRVSKMKYLDLCIPVDLSAFFLTDNLLTDS